MHVHVAAYARAPGHVLVVRLPLNMAAVSAEVEGEQSEVPTAIGEGDLEGQSDVQEDIEQKQQDFCVESIWLTENCVFSL